MNYYYYRICHILYCIFILRTNCDLISIGIHLETFLEKHPSSKYLFTEDDNELAPKQLKNQFSAYLKDNVYWQEQFKDLAPQYSKDGDIATHSG